MSKEFKQIHEVIRSIAFVCVSDMSTNGERNTSKSIGENKRDT